MAWQTNSQMLLVGKKVLPTYLLKRERQSFSCEWLRLRHSPSNNPFLIGKLRHWHEKKKSSRCRCFFSCVVVTWKRASSLLSIYRNIFSQGTSKDHCEAAIILLWTNSLRNHKHKNCWSMFSFPSWSWTVEQKAFWIRIKGGKIPQDYSVFYGNKSQGAHSAVILFLRKFSFQDLI